jgi:hypothetical protein
MAEVVFSDFTASVAAQIVTEQARSGSIDDITFGLHNVKQPPAQDWGAPGLPRIEQPSACDFSIACGPEIHPQQVAHFAEREELPVDPQQVSAKRAEQLLAVADRLLPLLRRAPRDLARVHIHGC